MEACRWMEQENWTALQAHVSSWWFLFSLRCLSYPSSHFFLFVFQTFFLLSLDAYLIINSFLVLLHISLTCLSLSPYFVSSCQPKNHPHFCIVKIHQVSFNSQPSLGNSGILGGSGLGWRVSTLFQVTPKKLKVNKINNILMTYF